MDVVPHAVTVEGMIDQTQTVAETLLLRTMDVPAAATDTDELCHALLTTTRGTQVLKGRELAVTDVVHQTEHRLQGRMLQL